jgi:hypothetical protein
VHNVAPLPALPCAAGGADASAAHASAVTLARTLTDGTAGAHCLTARQSEPSWIATRGEWSGRVGSD